MFSLASLTLLTGCPEQGGGGGGGDGESWKTYCEPMNAIVSSAPKMVFFHMNDGAYGANNFMLWPVDQNEENGETVYRYIETGNKVQNFIPNRNWQIVDEPIWEAGRFAMDGQDPIVFTVEKPFVFGYLPYTTGTPWESLNGTYNNGSCPGDSGDVGGWPKCIDQSQLDVSARNILKTGQHYLARLIMGGTFSNADGTSSMSFSSHCYQAIFLYE